MPSTRFEPMIPGIMRPRSASSTALFLYIMSNYVTVYFVTYYITYRTVWNRINVLLNSLSDTVNRSTELS